MRAAWESMHLAAVQLADSSPIKHRLVVAFSKYLCDLDSGELPREVRAEFDSLRRDLTRVTPLRGETAVMATVRKMSNEEAGRAAQRIVRLFGALPAGEPLAKGRSANVLSFLGAEA